MVSLLNPFRWARRSRDAREAMSARCCSYPHIIFIPESVKANNGMSHSNEFTQRRHQVCHVSCAPRILYCFLHMANLRLVLLLSLTKMKNVCTWPNEEIISILVFYELTCADCRRFTNNRTVSTLYLTFKSWKVAQHKASNEYSLLFLPIGHLFFLNLFRHFWFTIVEILYIVDLLTLNSIVSKITTVVLVEWGSTVTRMYVAVTPHTFSVSNGEFISLKWLSHCEK